MSEADRVAELEAEVARLKGLADQSARTPSKSGRGWRWFLSGFLAFLVLFLAPLSVMAVWTKSIVYDTDRYVATVGPLVEDPAVQAALADQLTLQVLDRIDIDSVVDQVAQGLVGRGLPEQLLLLAPSAVSGVESLIDSTVQKVVTSEQFADAWVSANREAHEGLVAALEGNPDGSVTIDNGQVSIKAATLIETVKLTLADQGLDGIADRIPVVEASFVVFESEQLDQLLTTMRTLNTVANWLPILTLLLAAGAVAAAPDRRRGLVIVASVVAGGMLLLGLGIAVLRSVGLDALVDAGRDANASAAVFDQVVSLLRVSLRALGVTALIVAVAAWLAGPSSVAGGVRRGFGSATDWVRGATIGEDESGVRSWFVQYKRPLQVGVAVLAALAVIFWPYPTASVVLWIALVCLVVIALLEILGGRRESISVE